MVNPTSPTTYADLFATRGSRSIDGAEFRVSSRRAVQMGRVSFKEAFPGPPMPYYYLRMGIGSLKLKPEVNYGEGWFEPEAGSCLLVPPNATCQMRGNCSGAGESLFLAFSEAELNSVVGELRELDAGPLRRAPEKEFCDPYLTSLMKQLWSQSGERHVGGELMFEGAFISLIGRLLTLGGATSPRLPETERGGSHIVHHAREYMQANFSGKVTLEEIARAAGVSRPYLTRVFRQATGRTVHDHLLEMRIQHSKELMDFFGRNMNLAEIAEKCGFASHGHLTLAFRQVTGTTPQQYRHES